MKLLRLCLALLLLLAPRWAGAAEVNNTTTQYRNHSRITMDPTVRISDEDGAWTITPSILQSLANGSLNATNAILPAGVLTNGQAGNVGIGTNHPQATLDVAGAIRASGPAGSTNHPIIIQTSGPMGVGLGTGLGFLDASGLVGSIRVVYRGDNVTDLAFGNLYSAGYASSGEVLTLRGNGCVGIGTNSPQVKLHVAGNAALSGSIAFLSVTASNPPTSGAGTAYIFAATNDAGTAEIFTMDGAGTIKQISEHAMDAPPALLDDADPIPNVSKEVNRYLGVVRWINRSREAAVAQGCIEVLANSYEAWLGLQAGANVALLKNNDVWATNRVNWARSEMGTNWYLALKEFVKADKAGRAVSQTETFAEYNARMGLTNGNGLVAVTWSSVQAGISNAWFATYSAQLAASATNHQAPPAWNPPARQPVPAWMSKRGVQ